VPEGPPFLGCAIGRALATVHGRIDEEEKASTRDLLDETEVAVHSDAESPSLVLVINDTKLLMLLYQVE
jgi:hypothetical protein